MNLLHLYKDYHPVLGGIENHVRHLAESQAQSGHRVTVLFCGPGRGASRAREGGVEVIRAGRSATLASMPLSLSLPLWLATRRPDVVHIHSPFPLGEAANLLLGQARATVLTHHSDVIRQKNLLRLYGPVLRLVLARAHRIIATSRQYIETSPWLKPVRKKCVVVPLGVDPELFHPAEPPPETARLLFVGRHRYYKDLTTLLQALALLPEARLDILGSGPLTPVWKNEARRLDLGSRAVFHGDIPDRDLPAWYRRAGILVLPANSRAEAFGTVLLEAMASGLPCLTTEVGTGTSWVVKDGETGFVVRPGQAEALAEALARLLKDFALRQKMGQAGRRRVLEHFSQAAMFRGVEQVYRQALSVHNGAGTSAGAVRS